MFSYPIFDLSCRDEWSYKCYSRAIPRPIYTLQQLIHICMYIYHIELPCRFMIHTLFVLEVVTHSHQFSVRLILYALQSLIILPPGSSCIILHCIWSIYNTLLSNCSCYSIQCHMKSLVPHVTIHRKCRGKIVDTKAVSWALICRSRGSRLIKAGSCRNKVVTVGGVSTWINDVI